MYKVLADIPRPPRHLIEDFRECATPNVSDAMGRYGSMRSQMKPLWPGARIVGPAFTVQPFKADNLMVHLAIQLAKPGDVLVIDSAGYPDASPVGELICMSCRVKGIEGIVIDGGARDRSAISELQYPVFSTGVIPGGTFKVSPGFVNVPVTCAGTVVNPGDIIVADDDGVVVVPQDKAGAVLEASLAIVRKEEGMRERINAGETVYEILGLQKMVDSLGLKIER